MQLATRVVVAYLWSANLMSMLHVWMLLNYLTINLSVFPFFEALITQLYFSSKHLATKLRVFVLIVLYCKWFLIAVSLNIFLNSSLLLYINNSSGSVAVLLQIVDYSLLPSSNRMMSVIIFV